ncbi:MAG: BCCT family transporter [Eubacterium sp.]|nr:BCCT family transporter [Eubacterium sp.]
MSKEAAVAQNPKLGFKGKINEKQKKNVDYVTMILPLVFTVLMAVIFMAKPEQSEYYLGIVRTFVGDDCGLYYSVIAGGVFAVTMYMAFSKIGNIKLGAKEDKKAYSDFKWGTMIFTSTMGADILFYSLSEWSMYASDEYIQAKGVKEWAATYPLFHWGPLAWGLYIVLAVAFGYMINVKKCDKQKYSEACRGVLGDKVDGWIGKAIDIFAVFALICGAATTFTVSAPLLSDALCAVVGLKPSTSMSVIFLLVITLIYTLAVVLGMKGIQKLSTICTYLFIGLLLYVLIFGGETRFILESSYQSLGNMLQNALGMATFMDPLRETSFPQNWSIYYWAYWMVYCAGTPFFIGQISKGRTIKETVLGGYAWALAGTFMSFMILGNYSMAQQFKHNVDIIGFVDNGGSYSQAIIRIFDTLPLPALGLILLIASMIAFYSTTFDGITMVISTYSYKKIESGQEPDKKVMVFWALILIVLPIALIFTEKTMYSVQSVTIIGAAPIGFILILIIISFFKDVKKFTKGV